MIELNDSDSILPVKKATFKKNTLKKQSKRIKNKFTELDGEYSGKSKRKKIVKEEFSGDFVPPEKTKEKNYDVHEYVKGILEKYEAELTKDFTQLEDSYGKIIDWGNVDLDGIVEKLLMTLETLCSIKLFPYQKIFAVRVFQSVLLNDGEEITALWSRQSGKSETITDVVATLMAILPILAQYFPQLKQFERGLFVGVFAPTEPQAKTISERFRLRISSQQATNFLSDPEVDIAVDSLWMSNGSYVRIHSAAPQAKVESKTYHIIIIDEAQDVSDERVLKSIHPMGAATSATIIKLGTPHMRQCEFLEAINRNKRMAQTSKHKVKNHFEFDYTVVSRYNERYARWIQKEKARYGEDSDYFRMSYRLEWLLQKGMALVVQDFEKYMKAPALKLETLPDNRYMYVAGLDLGKKYDSTVLTLVKLVKREAPPRRVELSGELDSDSAAELASIFVDADMYYKQVVNWYEWEGDNWESQIDDIVRVCKNYDTLQVLCIDSTGVGDPIHEMVARRLSFRDIAVLPVYFSLQNQHKLAQVFYKNVNHSNVRIPCHASAKKTRKHSKFMVQLLDAEKVWKNDKMIIRHGTYKGAKDDYVQSLLLALTAAEEAVNMGSAMETPNYFIRDLDPTDDAINYIDDVIANMEMSEIRGFQNVRRAAREGKLRVTKATFHKAE